MNSVTVLAGTDGLTTMTLGSRLIAATVAMSRMKLELSFSISGALLVSRGSALQAGMTFLAGNEMIEHRDPERSDLDDRLRHLDVGARGDAAMSPCEPERCGGGSFGRASAGARRTNSRPGKE